MKAFCWILLLYPFLLLGGEKGSVSGVIKGTVPASMIIIVDQPYPNIELAKQQVQIVKSSFSWSADLEHGTLVAISLGDTSLQIFVEPGDALEVNIDWNSPSLTADFSGKGAGNNSSFYEFNKKFANDFDRTKVEAAIQQIASVDEFESQIFDQRLKQMKFLKAQDEKNMSAGFRKFIENQITYNYFRSLLLFPSAKSGYSQGLTLSALPSIMLQELSGVPVMNESAMNSPAYRDYVIQYVRYYTAGLINFLNFKDYSDLVEREYNYALKYLSGEPFLFWLSDQLFTYCDKTSSATVKKLYQALSQSDHNGTYAKQVSEKCQEPINAKEPKKEKLDSDEASGKKKEKATKKSDQPFTLLDLKGDKVYLDDFMGKVVYVDFWASWCGPCRQQFPFAKEIKHALTPDQKKQVVFLYISIDESEEKWKKAIEQNEIEGFHTNSPGGWGSTATRYFGVQSIPRYMLIDKKGNIADSNAKRPGSGQAIIQDILMLL